MGEVEDEKRGGIAKTKQECLCDCVAEREGGRVGSSKNRGRGEENKKGKKRTGWEGKGKERKKYN